MHLSWRLSGPDGHRSIRAGTALAFAFILLSATVFAACSGGGTGWGGNQWDAAGAMPTLGGNVADVNATPMADAVATPAAAANTGPASGGSALGADVSAIWAARPTFVDASAETSEAYAYALDHPQVVMWMPCYCGCVGMGHRSNLDCYFEPAVAGKAPEYDQHASGCDVCVKTTLMAKRLVAEGKTLREVRSAVDQTFGGGAPGTPTDQPPA